MASISNWSAPLLGSVRAGAVSCSPLYFLAHDTLIISTCEMDISCLLGFILEFSSIRFGCIFLYMVSDNCGSSILAGRMEIIWPQVLHPVQVRATLSMNLWT